MFFQPEMVLFSFCVGILGAMFGGTQTFICTGFAGIILYILRAAGVEPTMLGDQVLGSLLLPAIIFNGACLATAVAAHRHPGQIEGWDTSRSLIFLHDTPVMLVGGAGGAIGYLLTQLFTALRVPTDPATLAIVAEGVVIRLTLAPGRKWNPDATEYFRREGVGYWVFQSVGGLAMATVCGILLKQAGPDYYGLGFSISAALLLFTYAGDGQKMPTTHQITNLVGYVMGLTGGNVALGVLFGWISGTIYLIALKYLDDDCGTLLAPDAIGIATATFLANLLL